MPNPCADGEAATQQCLEFVVHRLADLIQRADVHQRVHDALIVFALDCVPQPRKVEAPKTVENPFVEGISAYYYTTLWFIRPAKLWDVGEAEWRLARPAFFILCLDVCEPSTADSYRVRAQNTSGNVEPAVPDLRGS